MTDQQFPEHLGALADLHGVATAYWSAEGDRVQVPAATVRAALAAMGVEAHDEQQAAQALAAHRDAAAQRLVPRSHVLRPGRPITYDLPVGELDAVAIHLEDGEVRELAVERPLPLPDDLPKGYHEVRGRRGDREDVGVLIVAPIRCPVPADRQWGWMTQLYQLRSGHSWGMGDAADLRVLAERSARELGAGFVVCNPLHAVTPVPPIEPSPYFPSSRRFLNPLYLRIEEIPELEGLGEDDRARVEELAAKARALNAEDRIDYDAVWSLKREALGLLHQAPRSPERAAELEAFVREQGRGLLDFATFSALAELHGEPWQQWPADLQHPDSPAVRAFRDEHPERVDLHLWLQWLTDEQLARAQDAAVEAGMPLGCVHDLAVGVDPGGADAWALQDELATGVSVGAPPDAFNQRGQDWRQPPLRPDRLIDTGFRPLRDMLRSVLAHAGGVRIDHVLGLFRLYWIPPDAPPDQGTYVRYPAEDLLAVLALEAERAGAVVVGEDLGTVEDGVRERLWDSGVLGSRVLYFQWEKDGEGVASHDYPELAMASVNTHDLPTAAAWWRDEQLRLQQELGLVGEGRSIDDLRADAARNRDRMVALLHREGCIGDDADDAELIRGMHAFLARTRSRLVAAAPADAVGDLRQPNLPGTIDEYPNWRLPLARPLGEESEGADADGHAHELVTLEGLLDDQGTHALARLLADR